MFMFLAGTLAPKPAAQCFGIVFLLWLVVPYDRVQQTFSVKGQTVKMLVFVCVLQLHNSAFVA